MRTLVVTLSDAMIRRHAQDPAVYQLRDPARALLFRYHSARTSGAYYLRHYHAGRERWLKVAVFPALSVKALLPHLPEIRARLALDANATHLQASGWATVADVLTWYRDRAAASAQLSPSRRSSIKSAIKCQLVPALGAVALSDLDRSTLDSLLIWPLQARYSLAFVKSVFGVLKAAFKQAHRLQLIAADPLAGLVFGDFIQTRIQPKSPRLRSDALPDLLPRLAQLPAADRLLPLLMLLHGTRIGETRRHRWDWIDWSAAQLTIPGTYTKNRQDHTLPLTPVALQILRHYQQQQQAAGVRSVWLFPGGQGRALGSTHANAIFQRLSGGAWTSHDLRKLARTVWADLGVDYIVGEQLLNHTLKDLDATYIHTALQLQKRNALEQYHAWLLQHGLTLQPPAPVRACA